MEIGQTLTFYNSDHGPTASPQYSSGQCITAVVTDIRNYVLSMENEVVLVEEMYRTSGLLVIRGNGMSFVPDKGSPLMVPYETQIRILNNWLRPTFAVDSHTKATIEAEAIVFDGNVVLRKVDPHTWREQ